MYMYIVRVQVTCWGKARAMLRKALHGVTFGGNTRLCCVKRDGPAGAFSFRGGSWQRTLAIHCKWLKHSFAPHVRSVHNFLIVLFGNTENEQDPNLISYPCLFYLFIFLFSLALKCEKFVKGLQTFGEIWKNRFFKIHKRKINLLRTLISF